MEEKRGAVALCWSCGHSHRPPPSLLANPLILVSRSLVLPTSSPGNKDFHSCAWGNPQQGREKREERWEEKGGVVKVGQFVDHWDQAYCLKLCLCVCMSVFTQHIPAQSALYYLRSGGICARQSFIWETWVGKFGNWAPLKNFHSPLNAAIPKLCVQPTATVGKRGSS